MRYKLFPNAGVEVSCMTIGSMVIGAENFGDEVSREFVDTVHRLVEQGVNIIDTAPRYGNGTSEKVVGQALRGLDRDKVLIATKFGSYRSFDHYGLCDARYGTVIREAQSSLLNLGTDHIDFFINHWPDHNTPLQETMAALNDLKRAGAVRFIGFSNCTREMLEEAQRYGKVDVIQVQYSLVNQDNRELMAWADSQGIGVMTYGSLGSGILSGSIRCRADIDKSPHLSLYDFFAEPKFSAVMELLGTLDDIAKDHGVPVAQVAINWSTQKEFVGTALIGTPNSAQGLENLHAFDWSLSDQEIARIDGEAKRLGIA